MICAPVAAVSGTVVTTEGWRGGASPGKPPTSGRAPGRARSGGALVDDRVPCGVVTGCAVSGQSFEDEDEGEGRAVAPGCLLTGRAVSGQSFEDEGRVVAPGCLLTGRAVSGQSFEAEGRVVAAGRLGAGGGFASAFSRATLAAALFGSKRGGSVGLLT